MTSQLNNIAGGNDGIHYRQKYNSNLIFHRWTPEKWKKYGFQSIFLEFITSYVIQRMQATLVNNTLSSFGTVKQGVPQGTVLEPLLIIIIHVKLKLILKISFRKSFRYPTEKLFLKAKVMDLHKLYVKVILPFLFKNKVSLFPSL